MIIHLLINSLKTGNFMKSLNFSISQHLFHPFNFPHQNQKKIGEATLKEKVADVALAIVFATGAMILTRKLMAGLVGVVVFYSLTAYHKIQKINSFQGEDIPNEPNTNVEDLLSQDENFTPKIIKKEKVPGRESVPKFIDLLSFFKDILKPILDTTSSKTGNPERCFIKNNTAPFPVWLQTEYKENQTSTQKNNLLFLKNSCPEVNEGLFISIRGDGDCTVRSVGAGLILQALLEEPNPSIENLFAQFLGITINLEAQAEDFTKVIKDLQERIKELRNKAKVSEDLLRTDAQMYRLPSNGYLNEEGSKIQATLDETRDLATILEAHSLELNLENQKRILEQINLLKLALEGMNALISQHIEKLNSPEEKRTKMIELMESDAFDLQLIAFLRKASAINIALNMEKMGGYVKQLSNQEEVILGEFSIFDLLMQRANARQPNKEYLQANINDALSLSMLFQQPLLWYRCEVGHEPEDRVVYDLGPEDQSQVKKHFYILNRPGHSDLILV
jgi:hypothetical protein